jgi:hypothetical protein
MTKLSKGWQPHSIKVKAFWLASAHTESFYSNHHNCRNAPKTSSSSDSLVYSYLCSSVFPHLFNKGSRLATQSSPCHNPIRGEQNDSPIPLMKHEIHTIIDQ